MLQRLKWRSSHGVLLILFSFFQVYNSERCPPIFGEIECPQKFKCELSVCKNEQGLLPPPNCEKITCGPDARCYMGNCYPVEGLPCDRNVLVAENTARSITSYCGRRGKCLGGRCAIDKCMEVLCNENEICRDGKCVRMLDAFCFSVFDCGPNTGMECRGNKCVRGGVVAESEVLSKVEDCNPGEIFLGQECVKQKDCQEIVCEPKFSCLNGVCLPMTGSDCINNPCPEGLVCKEGVCKDDPCHNHCPPEHACLNDGNGNGVCRHIQGMICHDDCGKDPYECINGQCVKNECARKVCQIGERCEGGVCIRVEGNLCTNPIRDCGEAFDCQKAACRDKIHPISGSSVPDTAA